MSILDSCIGLWQAVNYSGSGDWLDESGNGNDATFGDGSTSSTFPVHQGAYFTFDGNQYFEIPDTADLDFGASDPFTVLVVARQATFPTGSSQTYVSKRASVAASAAGWVVYPSFGSVVFEIADGSTESNDLQATEPTNGTVSAVGGVRDVSGDTVEVFVNSSPTGTPTTDATTGSLANTESVGIGAINVDSTPGSFFVGDIFAVAIWGSALSDADFAAAGTLLSGGTPSSKSIAAPGQVLVTGG